MERAYSVGERVFCLLTSQRHQVVADWYLATVLSDPNPGIDWTYYKVRLDKVLPDGGRDIFVEEPDMRPLSLLEKLADEARTPL